MIEDDLSKQLGSSPRDREWDEDLNMEPYITSMENGGTQYSKVQYNYNLSLHHNPNNRPKLHFMSI